MHLDNLINVFEKNVCLFGNYMDITILEHLKRLKEVDKDYESYRKHIVERLVILKQLSYELDVSINQIARAIANDKDAPKQVSPFCYDRDEFYAWWNNRKKK